MCVCVCVCVCVRVCQLGAGVGTGRDNFLSVIRNVEVMYDQGCTRNLSVIQCFSRNSTLSIVWCRTLCPCGIVRGGSVQRVIKLTN